MLLANLDNSEQIDSLLMFGAIVFPHGKKELSVSPYTIPASDIGRFGNCGLGILSGPPTATFSAFFGKTFHITERFGVHYEAQVANLFNINNWGIPNLNVGSSSFGWITNQQDGTPGSQAGPRSLQMSLRVSY